MNIKKLVASCAGAALILGATAIPALASDSHDSHSRGLTLNMTNRNTSVTNRVLTVSNTGFNQVEGQNSRDDNHHSQSGSASINTGAAWASSDVLNQVNANTADPCGCLLDTRGGNTTIGITNQGTSVTNRVLTVSNTGFNQVEGRGSITTAGAGSSGVITNIVNTNTVGTNTP